MSSQAKFLRDNQSRVVKLLESGLTPTQIARELNNKVTANSVSHFIKNTLQWNRGRSEMEWSVMCKRWDRSLRV